MAAVPALADGNLVVSASPSITTGSNFTVSVDLSSMSASAVGAQLSLAYDADEVEFVGVAGGDDFPVLIYSAHDAANDRVGFATGVSAPNPGITGGNIAKVTFKALVDLCADSDAVALTTGAFPNKIADNNGATISFTGSNSVSVSSYGAFALAGVPAGVTVPADAGFASAAVSVSPPTATDSCGASA
ncbi:MAG: cohesin domain-containing protein, partial [Planctomycetota bacterium]